MEAKGIVRGHPSFLEQKKIIVDKGRSWPFFFITCLFKKCGGHVPMGFYKGVRSSREK